MPGPSLTFEGLSNFDNLDTVGAEVIPPDPNGDAGPNHYVQTVNLSLRVFNKSTGAPLAAAVSLQSLFSGFGGLCEDGLNSDPIVLYDPLADHWLISYVAFDADLLGSPVPPFHECVACSQTADPNGAYYLYDFQMPNQWLNDYPKLGVWPDAYYMTDNQFDAATEDPHGAGVFAFDRAKMLDGRSHRHVYLFRPGIARPEHRRRAARRSGRPAAARRHSELHGLSVIVQFRRPARRRAPFV